MNSSTRLFSSVAAAAALLVMGGSAQAADVTAAPADLWSGFYLGAQAGYLWGTGDNEICGDNLFGGGTACADDIDDGFALSTDGSTDVDGFALGGYLGFNYRIDSVLLGVEGDVNWDNAEGKSDYRLYGSPAGLLHAESSIDWDASVRARLGYIFDERALVYVTGGPSWLSQSVDTNLCSYEGGSCGDTVTRFGWQLGGGAEYFVTDAFSIKAEYIHGWYGSEDLTLDTSGPQTLFLKQDLQTNVVRAGIAWHFGSF